MAIAKQNGASPHNGSALGTPQRVDLAGHRAAPPPLNGVAIGRLADHSTTESLLVWIDGHTNGEAAPARCATTAPLTPGQEVAIVFEQGDRRRPLIIGPILNRPSAEPAPDLALSNTLQIDADDDRVAITANREIVLRCGKSSITLTRAGKVIIRGAFLLSRSSGVNRIKGGSVQIN